MTVSYSCFMSPTHTKALLLTALLLLAGNLCAAVNLYIALDSVSAPFSRVDPGQEVTFRYRYGTSAVVDARLIHPLPAGARLVRWSDSRWNCTQGSDAVLCARRLDPTESFYDRILDLTIAAPEDPAGLVFNAKARIESDQPDPQSYDNEIGITMIVYHLLIVTTADDFGAGSLRDALPRANAECQEAVPCKITFAEPMRIVPQSPLPAITACDLQIDGGGYQHETRNRSFDKPRRVEISGEDAGAAAGFVIADSCSLHLLTGVTLQGLAIQSFSGNGVSVVSPADPGVSVNGCSVTSNLRGISVDAPKGRANVTDCLIVSNVRSGIAYWQGTGGALSGNLIGVGFGGVPMSNGASGVYVNAGWVTSSRNAIEYNHDFGAAVGPGATHFISYDDYIILNGGIAIDWGLDGPTATDRSGRMPPVPHLIDAYYVAGTNSTYVYGVIPMDENTPKNFYAVRANVADGDFEGGIPVVPGTTLLPATGSDLPFGIILMGNYQGRTITARTLRQEYLDFVPVDSSEFSAAIVVR
jgi:hypothetical protein